MSAQTRQTFTRIKIKISLMVGGGRICSRRALLYYRNKFNSELILYCYMYLQINLLPSNSRSWLPVEEGGKEGVREGLREGGKEGVSEGGKE